MILSHKVVKKLRKRLRTFTNEDVGWYVIAYLNESDRLADDPVEKLVGLGARLRASEDVRDEMVKLIEQTVASGPHYATVPQAIRTLDGTVTVKDVPALSGPIPPLLAKLLPEWNRVLILLRRGMLDRIRHCAKPDCKKLFWARFSHSAYHDEACRLAVESANPDYKQRRREFMRRQRKAEKVGKGYASGRQRKLS